MERGGGGSTSRGGARDGSGTSASTTSGSKSVLASRPESRSGNASEFVALELPQLNGGANLVVDLIGREGEQLRIALSGLSGMDVVALAQTFWKRPS